uniref:Uncharacterized protein n=1 Tax=Magallana gigas TaxID=29159 RepID=K1PL88_MAGGI
MEQIRNGNLKAIGCAKYRKECPEFPHSFAQSGSYYAHKILEIFVPTCPHLAGALAKVFPECLLLYMGSSPCPKEAESQLPDDYWRAVFPAPPLYTHGHCATTFSSQ